MNTNLISKYRNQIFGISIISIIIFHFTEDYYSAFKAGVIAKNLVAHSYYRMIGSIGVEIFIFLSGFGLFYAFSKNKAIGSFYKKRMKRLLIPYIPVGIIVWGISDFIIKDQGLIGFIKDFIFISLFTEGQKGIWFIGVMIILYILFPILYKIVDSKKPIINTCLFTFVYFIVMYGFKMILPHAYNNTEIALMRVPIFVIGILFGWMAQRKVKISKIAVALIIIIGPTLKIVRELMDFSIFANRIICTLYGISAILLICIILEVINWTTFNKCMAKVGDYSLELYMTHVGIRKIVKSFGADTYKVSIYLMVVAGMIISSICLHKITTPLIKGKKATDTIKSS